MRFRNFHAICVTYISDDINFGNLHAIFVKQGAKIKKSFETSRNEFVTFHDQGKIASSLQPRRENDLYPGATIVQNC